VEAPPEAVTSTARTRAVGVAALGVLVLVLLGVGVLTDFGPQLRLDAAVSEALYAGDERASTLNTLLEVLTAPGLTWVRALAFLPVLVWLGLRRAWWTFGWVLTAVLLVAPLTSLLKDAFGRLRPPFDGGGARYDSLSYPSGHSSGVATLVTVALVLAWPYLAAGAMRRLWVAVGVLLVVLVGVTRIWLGVHYLSDVLGGWALGLSWTLLTAAAFGALAGGRAALPVRR
jgi:undecaprenyl-diphosphatase